MRNETRSSRSITSVEFIIFILSCLLAVAG
jgi:hypothetical protein